MDPAPRSSGSSPRSAVRIGAPRRGRGLLIAFGGVAILLLGLGALTLRQTTPPRLGQLADGVREAQRRAGEVPQGTGIPMPPPRSPPSSLPAVPTSLPMPSAPTDDPPQRRYLLGDSAPPHPAPGHLFVDTQPEASVWVDGQAKGKTPLDVLVGPGRKVLRLEATGFRPVRETFEAGQGASIRRALVPLGAPK